MAPHSDGGEAGVDGLATREVDLSTINTHGDAYARVSVLWASVDGERVLDDRWGVGVIDELKFRVGVRSPGDARLLVGDDQIPLHPTDTITIRDFRGRFTFENVGTTDAALALDGTVKSTSVRDGAAQRVTTEFVGDGPAPADPATRNDEDVRVRHVVVNANGVDAVGVERGDGRPVSTEAADNGRPEPVNIYANHVKVNGREVTEYLHGEGPLDSVEFEVAYHAGSPFLLNWSGNSTTLTPGTQVAVTDFVGTYLVFQVQNGISRVRLDGYAAQSSVEGPGGLMEDVAGGNAPPVAKFTHTPDNPTTSQYVTFSDASYDPDGVVVLYHWTFGDGESSQTRNPRHRYDEPGVYPVSLTVTDERLRSNQTDAVIVVGNTPPVADFDFTPVTPTDIRPTAFSAKGWDPDGDVVAWHWNFGDGAVSTEKSPKHTFPDDGQYEVTLTVTDDQGGTDAITKIVAVQNVPPTPDFTFDPQSPLSLEAVTFRDASTDPDGAIVEWHWTFDDSEYAAGATANRTYDSPGEHTATLTVVDDDGDQSSVTKTVSVRNRAPEVGFTWTPSDPVTDTGVQFSDASTDLDGTITTWQWSFGDGATSTLRHPTHAYGVRGVYDATLTVTDDRGANATATETIIVGNAPPVASFTWGPEAKPLDQATVYFTDQSHDADGADTIVEHAWSFGDGNVSADQNPTHVYADDGPYTVSLTVTDDEGVSHTRTKTITVRNRAPDVDASYSPSSPDSRTLITFASTATDDDGHVVAHWWELPNGTRVNGSTVETRLPAGPAALVVAAEDDDGAITRENVTLRVAIAGPKADFTADPEVPAAGRSARLVDATNVGDAPVVVWQWRFGDGNNSHEQNPVHTYAEPGEYMVQLKVRDENHKWDTVRKAVRVNAPPIATFTVDPVSPSAGQTVWFNSTSDDPDGYVASWAWDFDNGATSTDPHTPHTFSTPGVYNVALTVTDSDGAESTKTVPVVVSNKAPKAAFEYAAPAVANATVAFFDTSVDPDGNLTTWSWNFGDGGTSTLQDPDHTFTMSTTYAVSLRVEDEEGARSTATQYVRVTTDHALKVETNVIYPDGAPVDLTLPGWSVKFTVSNDKTNDVLTNGTNGGPTGTRGVDATTAGVAAATFDVGEWASGDVLKVTVKTDQGRTVSVTRLLTAGDSALSIGPIKVPLPSRSTVDILNPTRDAHAPGAQNRTTEGYAVYHDPTEAVRGKAVALWTNGQPISGASVIVNVAYLGPAPDQDAATDQTKRVILRERITTNATGVAVFTVPTPLDTGVYPPGLYQVDITTSSKVNGIDVQSTARTFFHEDAGGVAAPNGLLA